MRARSLLVLGAVFMCSFAGRAAVFAEALSDGEVATARSAAIAPHCIDGAFAEALKAKWDEIAEREAATQMKSAELQAIESQVEKRIEELKALRSAIEKSVSTRDGARDEEARRVGAIYAQMKPQIAGGIIGGMDPEFAAGLLLSMEGDSASAIMATLEPKRAYAITVLMSR